MSRLKDEIDKDIAASGVPSNQFSDYKGAFFRLQKLIEIMSCSSLKDIEELVDEMEKEYGKYFEIIHCLRTSAYKILLTSRPNDVELKKRAKVWIDLFSDPGYIDEFEKNIG